MLRGDSLQIKMSSYPVPTINRFNLLLLYIIIIYNRLNYTGDWFDSLRAGFMFNLRPKQKSN